ncbi:MAG TPA: tetratricopeptide repeat protein [Gemmatimonadaceae bacterium]|nr:tetratricopeptide repeat protein [Gemmatimonadaceae bacterium]
MRILDRVNARLVYVALLAALPFIVYANGYRHAYHLDDAYTIVSNPSLRSLRAVPSYFADPGTYTSNREQADYRPVLQATYAVNYQMGGYDVWWWHFTQIVLHALVTLGVYGLCLRIITLMRSDSQPRNPDLIAFIGAAIVAVHPSSSGVVNYLNARSSLLTAAFLLPALIAYMRSADSPRYGKPQWAAAFLYMLALFTKVEAVGALGACWAFDLWQRGRENPDANLWRSLRASFDRRTLVRLAPALAVTIAYFVIRSRVMAPFPFADTRHAPDVGASTYLATQLTAWWYYIARWIAPVRLVADYLAYPVYRSWLDPVVLLSTGGWLAVGTMLVANWKRSPHLVFLAVASLALLSPTSSIAPLAEMVNEHRPYLPIAILSLAAVIPIGRALLELRPGVRRTLATSGAVVFMSLSMLTWRRNEVFATPNSFWADVLAKAPSSRAHLNYGVALMKDGDMQGALREFHQSLDLAPFWYYTHINMGVAYQHIGQTDSARVHYDHAVQYDQYSGQALTWRGEFRLAQRDFSGARDDFASSMKLGLQRYRNAKGLATAYAGLGLIDSSLAQTDTLLAIDRPAALNDIPGISTPYFDNVALHGAGIRYYEALQSRVPGQAWMAENIARLGRPLVVLASADTVSQASLMERGLDLLYQKKDPAAAVAQFRKILQRNPLHYGATYQLATALDRVGQTSQARELWVKVLGMATTYKDSRTAETARARLARP